MNVTSATVLYDAEGAIEAYIAQIDGKEYYLPNDPENLQCAAVLDWLAEGNVPTPFVPLPAPAPLTTEQKVNNLLSDYGLTRDEMRAALNAKSS